MFIPNKTYHAIKTVTVGIIAVLLLVIAGQAVLYLQLANKNKKEIQTLTAQLDSLSISSKNFNNVSSGKHATTQTQVTQIKLLSETNKQLIDVLIRNECTMNPYYMDKRLSELCPR